MRSGLQVHRWVVLVLLAIAGEVIFSLPFHVVRFFRPTFLDVFGLSNTQIGLAFSVYGITAMFSYFLGGILADRFSARTLVCVSLIATALGGVFFAQIPGFIGLVLLFGYWGVTTILLFWAAMLKAVREVGGQHAQGKAFGFLDGGRGLVAALLSSVAVGLLASNLGGVQVASGASQQAISTIIYFYAAATAVIGWCLWWVMPGFQSVEQPGVFKETLVGKFRDLPDLFKNKFVWYQAAIVVCAYCGYKGIDFYTLYATQVLGLKDVEASGLISDAAYLRPIAAIIAGILADFIKPSKIIVACFGALVVIYGIAAVFNPDQLSAMLLCENLLFSFIFVFAIRAIYFALLAETGTQQGLTGRTIGVVSVVGFAPDIFFAPFAGLLVDSFSASTGYRLLFAFLSLIALLGFFATRSIRRHLTEEKSQRGATPQRG